MRRLIEGNEIYVVELNDDLSQFKRQTLTKCFSADELWEDSDGIDSKSVQGPSVIKYDDVYYLLYSANNFRSPNYSVGLATSSSALGPWKKSNKNPDEIDLILVATSTPDVPVVSTAALVQDKIGAKNAWG